MAFRHHNSLAAGCAALAALLLVPLDLMRSDVAGARHGRCAGHHVEIIGTDGDDTLFGTSRSDVIAGVGGQDVIKGRGGNDIICGGSGWDVISGGRGADTILGNADRDVLLGQRGHDRLRGGGGPDALTGGPGHDGLWGSGSLDVLAGGWGSDRLYGGRDIDSVSFGRLRRNVMVDLRRGISRGQGGDVLRSIEGAVGGRGNDTIFGDNASNALAGGPGADELRARRGRDVVLPQRGRDLARGGRGRDLISMLDSRSAVTVDLGRGYTSGEGRDRLFGFENAQGSRRDDRIVGNGARNELLGYRGDDFVNGRGGFDMASFADVHAVKANLERRRATDAHGSVDRLRNIEGLIASPGRSVLRGDDGDNLLQGAIDSDEMFGGGGDDTLRGDDGGDTFEGGPGDDRIVGGPDSGSATDMLDFSTAVQGVILDLGTGTLIHEGTDRVSGIEEVVGSPHADRLTGGPRDDVMYARGGNDTVDGAGGLDILHGDYDDDRVLGGDGDDRVSGDARPYDSGPAPDGDDVVDGGPGADLVDGQGGDDEQLGGPGPDDLIEGPGSDRLDGGEGLDGLRTRGIDAPYEIDLSAGSFLDGEPNAIASIEMFSGSPYSDSFVGDDGFSSFNGGRGADTADGAGGRDILIMEEGDDEAASGAGDDHIVGGPDVDVATGGIGTDHCWYSETSTDCEYDEFNHPDPGFYRLFERVEWNGETSPHELTVYAGRRLVRGTVYPSCRSFGTDLRLERMEDGEWVWFRNVPVWSGGYYSRAAPDVPGTYRVHLPTQPSTFEGRARRCEDATSGTFTVTADGGTSTRSVGGATRSVPEVSQEDPAATTRSLLSRWDQVDTLLRLMDRH